MPKDKQSITFSSDHVFTTISSHNFAMSQRTTYKTSLDCFTIMIARPTRVTVTFLESVAMENTAYLSMRRSLQMYRKKKNAFQFTVYFDS